MNNIVVLCNPDDQKHLMEWWNTMHSNRAGRAELRRAEKPEAVFLTEGFHMLWREFVGSYWAKEKNLLGLAAVAGILAYIDTDGNLSFASACATGADGPPVSELRFSQLQKSHSLDEFYTRMRRILHILKNKANIISVADDVLHWYVETLQGEKDNNPRKHILVRWGMEYFQSLKI